LNAYRHPHPGILGRVCEALLNSARVADLRQAVMQRLPFLQLESDVKDVVYLTWMVDVETAQALAPAGVPLWQHEGKTPFTILSYRHGHFGPALLGPLRRIMPSPLQSNWRLYAEAPGQVVFLKNILGSPVHALATRLLSDVLQSHYPQRFLHESNDGRFRTVITPGAGSAPALLCEVAATASKTAPPQFSTWEAAVQFLACQHIAVAHVARNGRVAASEIDLPIELSQVRPLASIGDVHCPLLEQLGVSGEPFCFLVPEVEFRVRSELYLL
jgi:hypothetical protein